MAQRGGAAGTQLYVDASTGVAAKTSYYQEVPLTLAAFSTAATQLTTPTITGDYTDNTFANSAITTSGGVNYVNGPNDTPTQTLKGTADAYSIVTVTEQLSGATIGQVVADSSGNWSLALGGSLSDGQQYDFTATASDYLGNTSSTSNGLDVTVKTETSEGAISDSAVVNDYINAVNFNGGATTLTGTAEAGDTVVVTDAGNNVVGTATAGSNGSWSLGVTGLQDGQTYSYTATATDAAGNTAPSDPFTFTVKEETSESAISDSAVVNGYINAVNFNGGATTLTGTAEAGDTVVVTDAGNNVVGTATAGSNGSWSLGVTGLQDGQTYSYTATATDAAGNTAPTQPFTFTVDATAPGAPTIQSESAVTAGSDGKNYINGLNNGSGSGQGTIITFDDRPADISVPIENGYAGLNWNDFYVINSGDLPGTGYETGVVTQPNAAYNGWANPASFNSANLFTLTSGDFTAAWYDERVTVNGVLNGVVEDTATFNINTQSPTLETFNWSGINEVDFTSNGGSQFVLDNLTLNGGAAPQTLSGTAEAGSTINVYLDGSNTSLATTTVGQDGTWSVAVGPFTDGTHSLTATATDAAGNTSGQSDPYTFTVATQSPTVSAAETVSGLTNQNTDTITVTASAEAVGSNTVANVEIFDGGTNLGAATSNGNGTWSLTTGTLTDGAHNFSTTVTDAAGNAASATLAEVDVATQSPTVSAAETVSGLTNQNTDTITVTASAEAVGSNTVANVEIFDGGTDLGAATSNGNGTWSLTTGTLTNGAHNFSTTVTDAAGNTASATPAEVDVATQSPTVSAAETVSGLTNQNTDTITVTASAEAVGSNTVANVEIFDGGTDLGAATSNGNGTWSLTTGTLTDGAHNFSTTVTDAAGNATSATLAEVDVATQSPTVSAAETVSGLTNQNTDTITVTASAEAVGSNTVANVEIFDGGTDLGAATSNGNGTWGLTTGTLTDGAHNFSTTVTDAAGNATSATLAEVDVATQSPTVSAAETVSGLTNQNTDTITVTASAEAVGSNTVANVEIFDGGTDLGAATSNGNGTWSLTTGTLTDGAHNFSTTVTDAAGNTASATLAEVDVATQSPAAGLAELVSGLTNKTSDILTVTARAENVPGDSIANVEIFDGSADLGAATSNGNGTWNLTASGLTNGSHSFTALVTDAADNSTTTNAETVTVKTSTSENAISDAAVVKTATSML